MQVLKGLNYTLAFALELAMLGAITFAAYLLFDNIIISLTLSFMALMGTMIIWAVVPPRATRVASRDTTTPPPAWRCTTSTSDPTGRPRVPSLRPSPLPVR